MDGMKWLWRLLDKYKAPTWHYAGCVTATTTLVDDEGKSSPGGKLRGDYLLEERSDGKRRYKLVGYPGSSHAANYRLDCVEALVMGADLPSDILPEKKETKTADLVVFPGGKK
jgi:hypothetical protein